MKAVTESFTVKQLDTVDNLINSLSTLINTLNLPPLNEQPQVRIDVLFQIASKTDSNFAPKYQYFEDLLAPLSQKSYNGQRVVDRLEILEHMKLQKHNLENKHAEFKGISPTSRSKSSNEVKSRNIAAKIQGLPSGSLKSTDSKFSQPVETASVGVGEQRIGSTPSQPIQPTTFLEQVIQKKPGNEVLGSPKEKKIRSRSTLNLTIKRP